MADDAARSALLEAAAGAEALLRSAGAEVESIVDARRDTATDDEHDPEGATLAFERSQADTVRRGAAARLDQIAAALARLDAGTYGRCERCGDEIPSARLEIRPWATDCVACATGAVRR